MPGGYGDRARTSALPLMPMYLSGRGASSVSPYVVEMTFQAPTRTPRPWQWSCPSRAEYSIIFRTAIQVPAG
eukprot:16410237-Heterocapsa_arctica.AAC.1